MGLEFALEYIGPDELIEVTPKSLRIRTKILNSDERRRAKKASK
jgi:GTP-binding protein